MTKRNLRNSHGEILHRHHIVPRHAGGTNDERNIAHLTIAEHAEAHRVLYEKYGRWQDKIAWEMLSGQIPFAEARLAANIASQTGRPKSAEHRKKLADLRRGKRLPEEVRNRMSASRVGLLHSEETKQKIRAANIGKKIPEELVRKQALVRQKTDGTPFHFDGVTYGSFSEAATALMNFWGISKEAARTRIRHLSGQIKLQRQKAKAKEREAIAA